MRSFKYRRILAWLLVLAAALSPVAATAADWRCDDGRPCVSDAPSCCPAQRGPVKCDMAAMPCCAADVAAAAEAPPSSSCCAAHPGGAAAAAPALADPARRAPEQTVGTPACRCDVTYSERVAARVQRVIESPPAVALPPGQTPLVVPSPSGAADRLRAVPLASRPLAPLGGRAPPTG